MINSRNTITGGKPKFYRSGRSLVAAVGILFLLGATVDCKKKPAESKGDKAGKTMASGDMDTMAAGGMDTMAAGGMDTMAAGGMTAKRPAVKEPAVAVKVDPELTKQLNEDFGDAKAAAFGKLVKSVQGVKGKIDGLGKEGKALYPHFLGAAEALGKIGANIKAKKFDQVPPLLVFGYIATLHTVKQLAKAVKSAAKRAAKAARSLKIGAAKKHGRYAASLASPAKVAGQLLKHHAMALEKIMTGKSPGLRVGVFESAIGMLPKVDAWAKKLIAEALKRFHASEKDAGVKKKMAALLTKL